MIQDLERRFCFNVISTVYKPGLSIARSSLIFLQIARSACFDREKATFNRLPLELPVDFSYNTSKLI